MMGSPWYVERLSPHFGTQVKIARPAVQKCNKAYLKGR
jgi:hypothetical protein